NFRATKRPSSVSSALYTTPMPVWSKISNTKKSIAAIELGAKSLILRVYDVLMNDKGEDHAPTSQESEFERLCRTLGEIGETGMPVETHLVRGELAAPSPAAIRGTLPREAQLPGQAEPAPVPIAESRNERGERNCALQGTTGWSAEVLRAGSGMRLRSGKLPFLGSEDEFFYHTGSPGDACYAGRVDRSCLESA